MPCRALYITLNTILNLINGINILHTSLNLCPLKQSELCSKMLIMNSNTDSLYKFRDPGIQAHVASECRLNIFNIS